MLPLSDDIDFACMIQCDWYENYRKTNQQIEVVGFVRCPEENAIVHFDGKYYAAAVKDSLYDRFEISYKVRTLAIEGKEPFPIQYFPEDKEYDPFDAREMLMEAGRYCKVF